MKKQSKLQKSKNQQKREIWFKRKRFGLGWYPSSWQGWLVTFFYAGFVILLSMRIDENSTMEEVMIRFAFPSLLLTLIFMKIAYKKGQSLKWQWDRDNFELTGIAVFIIFSGIVGAYFLYLFQRNGF